jgi:succinyl-diaminopimelate desuccinylase
MINEDMSSRICDAIDREWIARCTADLVAVNSVTMDEAHVCQVYESQLRKLGLVVDVREVTPGRNNLYACIRGTGSGPSLIFNGHLDTIPVGTCPPCRREGDRIYGRGATDMKGGMAAILAAAKALLASGVRLKGDVWFTAVVGHEEPEAGKDGPKAFIEDVNNGRLSGDRILIAEGRDALWVMSMGSLNFTVTLSSDKGGMHTQYVPFSENPIRFMGAMINRICEFQADLDAGSVHPLAGAERIDIGIANAGDYFNRTPTRCVLTGTRRWAPGKTAPEVLGELKELVMPIARAGSLGVSVEMVHEREPFETPIDDGAVQAVSSAHKQVTGTEAEYVGMRIVGDANLYVHGCGLPTFYYGPSNQTAHADVEWVSAARLEQAAKVYALAAVKFCGSDLNQ